MNVAAASATDGDGGLVRAGARVGREVDRVVVWLWGEHDIAPMGIVSTALAEAVELGDLDVVVDLADVSFMDASTVRALVCGRALLSDGARRLIVRHPQHCARTVLEACDLVELVEPAAAAGDRELAGAENALGTWVEVPSIGQPAGPAAPSHLQAEHDDHKASSSR